LRILAVEDGGFPEGIPGKRKGKALLVGVITSNSIPDWMPQNNWSKW